MATTKELIQQINQLFTENKMESFMDYFAEEVVWDMYSAASGHTTFNGIAEINQMDTSNIGDSVEVDHLIPF